MNSFEETKRLLEDSTFYYIITTNMEGRYSYANNCYSKAFSHLYGSIIGQPYEITMHPEDTKVCEEVAAKCFTYPDSTFPATIRKHDGKGGFIITQWEYKALIDEHGNPAGMFCLGYDITDYTAYYEQLKDARSLLREISFYQSHVVRKPLANIMGLAKILERMELDQNLRNICNMLIESSQQLDAVIKEAAAKQKNN